MKLIISLLLLAALLFLVESSHAHSSSYYVAKPYDIEQKESQKAFTLTARMVLQEAAYEPFAGRIAVAGVALDRRADIRWPMDMIDVLYQPRQFAGMHKPIPNYNRVLEEEAFLAVKIAELGYRPCGEGVYWYHADYIKPPKWTHKLKVACHIGQHIFYKES